MLLAVVVSGALWSSSGCGSSPFELLDVCDGGDGGALRVLNADRLVAGQPGEIQLAWQAGQDGMMPGDALRIELPTAWYTKHSCPNLDNATMYQTDQPSAPNFFGVLDGDPSNQFSLGVIPHRRLDGQVNRFKSILRARLTRGAVSPGDEVTFVIRAWHKNGVPVVPAAGGSGMVEGALVVGSQIPCAAPVEPGAIDVVAGEPFELAVATPSVAEVGEAQTLKLRLLDEYYNACTRWSGGLSFTVPDGITGIPERVSPEELAGVDGVYAITYTASAPGTYTIVAQYDGLDAVASNPTQVVPGLADERIYWGDLHAHSEFSKDGMGAGSFAYARDASLLDFFALTEHHTQEDNPFDAPTLLPDRLWEAIKRDVRDFYEPDAFVTLLAFENSAASPSGHQNIYFPTDEGPLLLVGPLNETWEAVRRHSGFIIQHHTGIIFERRGSNSLLARLFALFVSGAWVGWDAFADVPRPAVEIYSLHGQSEYLNPEDALAYERHGLQLPRDPATEQCGTGVSRIGPHYARDAWASGLKLGVVSGSDDHRAQPGRAGGGLTAVRTDALTREAVFSAINERSTYATTGDRIILDFRINGAPMGSELTTAEAPELEVRVVGTAPIEFLQIMRHEMGQRTWSVLHETRDRDAELTVTIDDPAFTNDTVYYVRVQQTNTTHGRAVRAWSSPIWVRAAETP